MQSSREPKKPFPLPYVRPKILPSTPDKPLPAWERSPHNQDPNATYEDVVIPSSTYVNIATDAFEMVDDHIYDLAEVPGKKSSSSTSAAASIMYQMTATDAHVKAVAQMALARDQKHDPQFGRRESVGDSPHHNIERKFRHHSAKDMSDDSQANTIEKGSGSPRTQAHIPPRNFPRTNGSPVHHSIASIAHDASVIQTKWRGLASPPHADSPAVPPKLHGSPVLPVKQFSFPTQPLKERDGFNTPELPPKSANVAPPPPPPKASKPMTSPQKVLPLLPPKDAPAPPPRTTSSASEAPKISNQSKPPAVHSKPKKPLPSVPIPPPKPLKQECPALPPKSGNSLPRNSSFQTKIDHGNEHHESSTHQAAGMSLGMFLANAQQQGNPISKRYYHAS